MESHLHGEIILQHGFPQEYDSLTSTLASLPTPLRPVGQFKATGRPKDPKRHERKIGGIERPFLLPVDQAALNKSLETALRAEGWTPQPVATGEVIGGAGPPRKWKGDFVRNEVFVEVEFGNVASMYRDFFKFQIANRAREGQVAVLVVATQRLAKFFDSGVATYETALRDIPFLAVGIQMPVCFIGIEPSSFDEIGARYEEMRRLCEENGLECHTFETALGADVPVESEPGSGSDVEEEAAEGSGAQ
jgi:hypothetical protein